MRLELRKVRINDVQWADKTHAAGGILHINKAEAIASVSDDSAFAQVDLDLARPGESVRIIPVKDCIEPRVKLTPKGTAGYFPGFCAPMERAGEGITVVLAGACVVTCGPIVAFQEGLIDMSGPGAPYSPFSATNNVVLVVTPVPGLNPHAYETAIREAGLKLSVYLAGACKDATPDEVEVLEKGTVFEETKKYPNLPRVLNICMSITQGLLHDTYVYAADLKPSLPTLLHPNEVLDGALVSGNCVSACDKNTTWHHVNNPVMRALYARHGKDVNLLGMIPAVESTVLAGKQRAAMMNLTIAKELGADAVIITEEGYGNPDSDFCLNTRLCEQAGIKAVVISDEAAGTNGASQSVADATPELVSFVSAGNVNEMVELPPMKKIIGDASAIVNLSGGDATSLREDGSLYVELQSIIASTCEIGFNKMRCEWV